MKKLTCLGFVSALLFALVGCEEVENNNGDSEAITNNSYAFDATFQGTGKLTPSSYTGYADVDRWFFNPGAGVHAGHIVLIGSRTDLGTSNCFGSTIISLSRSTDPYYYSATAYCPGPSDDRYIQRANYDGGQIEVAKFYNCTATTGPCRNTPVDTVAYTFDLINTYSIKSYIFPNDKRCMGDVSGCVIDHDLNTSTAAVHRSYIDITLPANTFVDEVNFGARDSSTSTGTDAKLKVLYLGADNVFHLVYTTENLPQNNSKYYYAYPYERTSKIRIEKTGTSVELQRFTISGR